MRPGTRLGVDVGAVRVGVARCDPEALLATPVATLDRDDPGDADRAHVAALVATEGALEVVVGLPRSMSGQEGPAARAVRGYAADLARRVHPVAVRLVDERLTTVDAHRALRAAGRSQRRHRRVVDQVAAVVILQSALDAERRSGRPPGEVIEAREPRQGGNDDRPATR